MDALDSVMQWFPYSKPRPTQRSFLRDALRAQDAGKPLLVHAPTGTGKTGAALAASLASSPDKVLYFTPRTTQHNVVIKDVNRLAKRGTRVPYADLVGKPTLCVNQDIAKAREDFYERCSGATHRLLSRYRQRDPDETQFYETGDDFSKIYDQAVADGHKPCRFFFKPGAESLPRSMPWAEALAFGREQAACPHKLTVNQIKASRLLILHYEWLIQPRLLSILERYGETPIEECTIIVDEAHNLPDAVRDRFQSSLQMQAIDAALDELAQVTEGPLLETLRDVRELAAEAMRALDVNQPGREVPTLSKRLVPSDLDSAAYRSFVDQLMAKGEELRARSENPTQVVHRTAGFLRLWSDDLPRSRYVSMASNKKPQLVTRLIDPAAVVGPIFQRAKWSLLMSGTLYPPHLFADQLGLPHAETAEYQSPFPARNRLVSHERELDTRFRRRSPALWDGFANRIRQQLLPQGNVAIFGQSKETARKLYARLKDARPEAALEAGLEKSDVDDVLDRFRQALPKGLIFFGHLGGSFGEGIDFKDGILPQVFIVGAQVRPGGVFPSEVARFYSQRFGPKVGQAIAYHLPAASLAAQAAGRGIRSESDVCRIAFLDARYSVDPLVSLLPAEYRPTQTDRKTPNEVAGDRLAAWM